MALYLYKAFLNTGAKVTGTVDASSVGQARELLQQKGMYPLTVELAASAQAADPWWKKLFAKKVTIKEKVLFTKQFAILLKSGVPLVQALDMLADQFEGALHRIIITLKDGVKEGESLAHGMQQYPQVFENIYVQLVRAGEASGKLELILDRLTSYLTRKEELEKKIKGAFFYPAFQLSIVGLVVVALLTFVVPTFQTMFESQGGALPTPTQILVNISDFFSSYYLFIGLFVAVSVVAFRYWKNTPAGSLRIDTLKLRIPVISSFVKLTAIVQFSRTLGMLIESGVNFAEALSIVGHIVDNKVLRKALEEAREKIVKQGRIAQYLKQTNLFPPLAIYLITTGEESGKLDQMLTMVGELYEKDLMENADTLTALLSPAILLVTAGIVGFIVISIALPMFNLASAIG